MGAAPWGWILYTCTTCHREPERGATHNAGYDIYSDFRTFTCDRQADSYRFQLILPASPHIDEERGPMTSDSRRRQENDGKTIFFYKIIAVTNYFIS
jgi:hypothetical protein